MPVFWIINCIVSWNQELRKQSNNTKAQNCKDMKRIPVADLGKKVSIKSLFRFFFVVFIFYSAFYFYCKYPVRTHFIQNIPEKLNSMIGLKQLCLSYDIKQIQ